MENCNFLSTVISFVRNISLLTYLLIKQPACDSFNFLNAHHEKYDLPFFKTLTSEFRELNSAKTSLVILTHGSRTNLVIPKQQLL